MLYQDRHNYSVYIINNLEHPAIMGDNRLVLGGIYIYIIQYYSQLNQLGKNIVSNIYLDELQKSLEIKSFSKVGNSLNFILGNIDKKLLILANPQYKVSM